MNTIKCQEYFNINNSLITLQDFTKQAIRGEKGDLGLNLLEQSGKLSLGGFDSGLSGRDMNNEIQLYIAGKRNSGANNGRKGHTTYKLKIDGYDNNGSTVYPILCQDESKQNDFYVKNRKSAGSKPEIYVGGDLLLDGIKSGRADNIKHHLVPEGTIIAFNSNTNIPHGWRICNGKYNTPDLRGRFILGEGINSSYYRATNRKFRTIGGHQTVKLTNNQMPRHNHLVNNGGSHSHTGNTSTTGSHSHHHKDSYWAEVNGTKNLRDSKTNAYIRNLAGRGISAKGDTDNYPLDFNRKTDSDGSHKHSLSINYGGSHGHTLGYSGSTQAHENMPPYYVLIYIMKVI